MKTAIIGSGNIGTDLLLKILNSHGPVEVVAMAGVDPSSEGLRRAAELGVATTSDSIDGLTAMQVFDEVAVAFDATSAGAHAHHREVMLTHGKRIIDLTPAALGPYVVPVVDVDDRLDAPDVNMVTCGGQATIPMVAAVASVTTVHYAEIVASIASLSAGPGTRANIDEFTQTTARALREVGGAKKAKAIIILNPADPPITMRNTVHCLVADVDVDALRQAITNMADAVRAYVPGYRLAHDVQITLLEAKDPAQTLLNPRLDPGSQLYRVTILLQVRGAGLYLPPYAGNLDIMTSAALRVAEVIAERAKAPQR